MKTKITFFTATVLLAAILLSNNTFAQAPANDDCAGAIPLTVSSTSSCTGAVTGDAMYATESLPTSCGGGCYNDLWYKFVATSAKHDITVVGSSGFDAIVDLRSGGCNGTNIACASLTGVGGTEVISATGLTIGNTYLVRVCNWSGSTFTFTICVTAKVTLANDDCTGAIPLTVGTSCVETIGTVKNATQSIPGIICNNSNGDANDDVWFSFVATSATPHIITLVASSDLYPFVDLRTGGCNGANIDCGTTGSGGTVVINTSTLVAGNTYYIRVYDGFTTILSSTTFTFTICVTSPYGAAAASACPRATMVNDYVNSYLGANVSDSELAWTGDTATCTVGTISTLAQTRTLMCVNYFRKLVGLPGNITFDATLNGKCQEAALMMNANNQLSHFPTVSWKCYSSDGALAASKSNLSVGGNSANAIFGHINDPGVSNTHVGHRRWVLNSKADIFGHGSTLYFDALWISPSSVISAANVNYIAYPSAGFFPAPLVPSSNRWSFGKDGADFTNATIQMTNSSGASVAVTLETLATSYADNTIVWQPSGIVTNSLDDLPYIVQVNNVVNNGVSSNYTYTVIICPIAYPPQCPTGSSWSESNCDCSGGPIGITNIEDNNFINVYPNPTSGIINIEGQVENAQIKIYNLLGECVYQNMSTSSNFNIDLSSQAEGVYFISLQTNEGTVNKKIVISH